MWSTGTSSPSSRYPSPGAVPWVICVGRICGAEGTSSPLVAVAGHGAAGARQPPLRVDGIAGGGRNPGRDNRRVPPIYVTGHRNPDTDSIASAIGYAELKRRLDPHNEYVPV